ncbi:hypothetical protein AAON49_00700 [Pseudotenacibaculum sp. MALMAid0570]|uniref:hypothetical protein n=1 Tax=Pseudotenacibaculum sp. MALMAid0570 TaxID=3143938 RepID=UPI0032DEB3EC
MKRKWLIIIFSLVAFVFLGYRCENNKFYRSINELKAQNIELVFVEGVEDYSDVFCEKIQINKSTEVSKILQMIKKSKIDHFLSVMVPEYSIYIRIKNKDNQKEIKMHYRMQEFVFEWRGVRFKNEELSKFIYNRMRLKK